GARHRPGVSARASHGRGTERRRLAGRPGRPRPLRGRAPALGGRPGNGGGCGERSAGARRQPRCQMAARSSLLRRPTPGARPSRERFRRALARVGCAPGALSEAAVDLSRAHMALIAAATVLPPAHAELLAALAARYRLGLVSNFDDTGTAYGILVRHGIARWFDTVVISEGLGLRKPHPAVARAGLRGLGLAA